MFTESVICSCSTSRICRIILVAKPVISHQRGKDRIAIPTGYVCGYFRHIYLHSGRVNQAMKRSS